MQIKSFWHLDPKTSLIKNQEILKPKTAEISQFHSLCSNVSIGSERLVAEGRIPKSLFKKMKVPHQKGDFSFPIQYGYSLVVKDKEGHRFHLMHPHQNKIQSNINALTSIPQDMSLHKAAQISNMETIVNAIWDSGFQYGDQILVCGIGSIGILLAYTLKNQIGINLKLKETNPDKRDILKSLGFDVAENESTMFDLCFHCSGQQEGLQFCLDRSKTEAKIIELSWYGDKNVSLPLGTNFHHKRIKIISSQVSQIPHHLSDKHTFRTRKKLVIALLKEINIPEIVYHTIAFEELPQFFKDLRAGQQPTAFLYTVIY